MGRGEGQDGNADLCSRTGARYMSMTSFGLRGLTGLYHQHAGSRRTYESGKHKYLLHVHESLTIASPNQELRE